MNRKDNKISLVINTKNEEKNIKDCILSAKSVVDEIIVVDMASTDKTVKIAKELGAKVYPVKDYGYVEPARNFALSKPTNKWTLVVDADERLTKHLKTLILKLVKTKKYDGYKFPFKTIMFGKWIQHSMWWPDYQLRLFKTGHMDWPTKVHEKQTFKGEICNLEPIEKNAFVHYSIANIKEMVEMVDSYSSVEFIFQNKKNPTADDLVKYLNHEFRWRYLEHEGYLDGMHGFMLGKFMDVYRLLEVAKYWEKQGYEDMFSPMELKQAAENDSILNLEIKRLKEDIAKLREDLDKIKSAKFYRFWQFYCRLRDKFKDFLA